MWGALAAAVLLMAPTPDPSAPRPSRIVFASARTTVSQLYSVEPSGEGLAQLTFGTVGWGRPLASPNGRFVAAFHGDDLWLMRADGSRARLVARTVWGGVSWFADSRRLVFGDADLGIWTVAASGGPPRRITRGGAPSVSPDGRSIAFLGLDESGPVLVVRRNGRERTILKNAPGAPVWSPDGKWIAMAGRNQPSLELVRPTGGLPREVFDGDYGCGLCGFPGPTWSPDGRRVAYVGLRGIHVLRVSRGAPRLLLPLPTSQSAHGLAWSPAGDALAFVTAKRAGTVTLGGRTQTVASFELGEAEPGVGWSPAQTDLRYQAPEEAPPLVRVTPRELQARVPIQQLSADGDRVAYWLCPQVLGAWRPGDAQQISLGATHLQACRSPRDPRVLEAPAYDLALSGDRLAYLTSWAGNEVHTTLMLTTLERGDEGIELIEGGSDHDRPPALADVVGGGSALVYGSRGPLVHPEAESIWRVDEAKPVQITSATADLQPVAVDQGRIVARRADGSLELLDLGGGLLRTFDVSALGAALAGDDLLVHVQGELRDYSASTGELLYVWPLPDVPGAKSTAQRAGSSSTRSTASSTCFG